jgi:flavodoxin
MVDQGSASQDGLPMRSLVIVVSYHHRNTEKIANAIAQILGAEVKTPKQVRLEELREYDLVGFGSGIYDEKNHPDLLELADKAPRVANGKAFIFSTSGTPMDTARNEFHAPLKTKLQAKGYTIVGEFACAGLNTNSFLRFFGGLNKGRPNAADLEHAQEFARGIKQKASRA